MPDISKCNGEGCPSKESCYRYTSEESYLQSYADFEPEEGEDKCEYFWDNSEYEEYKKKKEL